MQAVILAGGKGTRLGDITREMPKPMIIIGDKPLLHHQVELLVKYGVRDIIMLVNYLKDPIMDYFGDGSRFDARIRYSEETQPLGTVGGIKEIEKWLKGDFLVFYGDVMINMDLSRLFAFHLQKKSQCTLVLHPNDHPFDSDLVEISTTGQVTAFHPKPHNPDTWYHNLVNAGVYVFSESILPLLEKGIKADFGLEVFPRIYGQLPMYGYRTSEYLKDMGTPERLDRVREDLESGLISHRSFEYPQKAIFLDRDGVLNEEKSFISTPDGLDLYEFTPAAIRKINESGYLSIVVTNQSAVARNLCTEEDVQAIHYKLETLLGEQHAWLDAIYYCPHHPDKGYPEENPVYKIDCDCRKPKTGMFIKASEDFNIRLSDSYMIGDSERDIQAGINAGCVTVGVRTGYGIKKTKVFPDYMFSNLAEAVGFIIDDPFSLTFENIYKSYKRYKGMQPWIILIGGNSRTGKSTLAAYLRLAFARKGIHVLKVELDNWLLPEENRMDNKDVYGRFQLPHMVNDLKKLFSGKILKLATYANHPDREPVPVDLNPNGAGVIIVDGIVALSSAEIREMANLRLFTAISPELFRKRIEEYYSWRGKSVSETAALVEKRNQDEYQLIEKESKLADLIINPSVS
jgi:D,D-heptose 1,7-bisphosphate phosphatase